MREGNRQRLFNALVDYLRTPLVTIARQSELARQSSDLNLINGIENSVSSALKLIDSYLLASDLWQGKLDLNLEPVAVSSVLYDTAHQLDSLAKAYNCFFEIDAARHNLPVMAHRQSLQAALTSLGQAFIEASQVETDHKNPITLATYGSRTGIVAGVFGGVEGLGNEIYRQALWLYGRARLPIKELAANSGVGVFVADSLLNAMSTHLHVAHHHNLSGLAATLLPSRQMSLM